MRRISTQELEGLRGDLERRARLARRLRPGQGDDWLAIAYLVAEVDYLDELLNKLGIDNLIRRPHQTEAAQTMWPLINVRPQV